MRVKKLYKGKERSFEIEVKRFYLPYVITDDCPKCGMETEASESRNYFSYPSVNVKEPVNFECEHYNDETGDCEGCGHSWQRKVIISLKLEAA